MTFGKTYWAGLLAGITAGIIVIGIIFWMISSSVGSLLEEKTLVIEENTVLHMKLDGAIGDYTYSNFNPS